MKTLIPKPENIGDIYRVHNFRGMPTPRYGVVYQGPDPDNPGHWCWWLDVDDGELYPWRDGEETPLMDAGTMELVRRNPLPDWEQAV